MCNSVLGSLFGSSFNKCKKNICLSLTTHERFLHDYFANLSRIVGFKKNVSLFDLPSIVSYLPSINSFKESQFFKYHRCQRATKVTKTMIKDCTQSWMTYVADIMKDKGKLIHLIRF